MIEGSDAAWLIMVQAEVARRGAFTVKYNKRRKQNRGLTGAEKCASRVNSQAPARWRIASGVILTKISLVPPGGVFPL